MENFVNFLYTYCTDFVINLANLLQLSYYEINAFIFVFIWPFLTVSLLLFMFYQIKELKNRPKNKA